MRPLTWDSLTDEQAAAMWRGLLVSPHVNEIIAEWLEWDSIRDMREATHRMSSTYRSPKRPYSEIKQLREAIPERPDFIGLHNMTPNQIEAYRDAQDASWRAAGAID